MAVRVDIDSDLEAKLLELVRPALRRKAEAVLHTAQVTAPVDTGAYKNSLRIDETPTGYQVVAPVDHAIYVEYGTRRMAAYRTLGRALDAAKNA